VCRLLRLKSIQKPLAGHCPPFVTAQQGKLEQPPDGFGRKEQGNQLPQK
jgi:hypothetical protein